MSQDRCSFCNKPAEDVHKLIFGPTVSICDECVEVCVDMLVDDARAEAIRRDPEKVRRLERASSEAGPPRPYWLGCVTFLVRDYDQAIGYFTSALGFDLVEDTALENGKRWVVVSPPGPSDARLLLARAATPEQESRVGQQAGGRVFLFLHTDDCRRDHEELRARGVKFREEPRDEPYGTVAVFEDLYGNKWDLLEPRG